jgi:hypothetical protein
MLIFLQQKRYVLLLLKIYSAGRIDFLGLILYSCATGKICPARMTMINKMATCSLDNYNKALDCRD